MMIETYPLTWLDSLILQTLNPRKTDVTALTDKELEIISENVLKESYKIQSRIKNEIFSLAKKRQIRLLVRKYHSNLIFLLEAMIENQKSKEFENTGLSKIFELVVSTMDELLSFVETRFLNYLGLDERVPITYLIVHRKEMNVKLNRLRMITVNKEADKAKIKIITDALSESKELKLKTKATFRQIFYERQLLKVLIKTDYLKEATEIFSPLDEILIEMNFNNRKYINFLIEYFSNNLSLFESDCDKLGLLQLYYKDFNQIYCSGKISYDPRKQNITNVLENWFKHEIGYLEKKVEIWRDKLVSNISNEEIKDNVLESKVECDLSADQLALILRAADESRIIKARSMNLVFQTIVPYLSTAFKKNLSYQSVRSKSYNAEDRDKDIAVQTLEKIIKKINSY
ncbi:hypothetical protein [Flavobacterium sp. T12S277]|uniref:hypothetical protein n=1 Tax=Flavobacterium sp. T12S277 TaxID=3402752 RepID=UPI003AE14FAE